MEKIYDVIVIGGGPAGYTAALYAARGGLKTLVLEKMAPGGQMTQTMQIDNYPGFEDGVDGITLGEKMKNGAQRFGVETKFVQAEAVQLSGEIKTVETNQGTYFSRAVVIATGAQHRHLGLPDEDRLIGRGVGYCAACDGMFYRGKTVAVVGGGNSAAADALLLSKVAKKVILIHRRDTLRADKASADALKAADNIEYRWNSQVTALHGDNALQKITVENTVGESEQLTLDGLFISIGLSPATALFAGQVDLDAGGYIAAGESTKTSLPGVYAVGDVRTKPVRQIVTATADGAVAAHFIQEYLG